MQGCIIRYKDTNLKAIHNDSQQAVKGLMVVLSDTKIQIWKQFTTQSTCEINLLSCIIRYKDTNLKAIHNTAKCRAHRLALYYPIQRYKFESKIQIWKQFTTFSFAYYFVFSCIIRYKDTNLKAIHNQKWLIILLNTVVLSDTKIQIWKQFTTEIYL